MDRSTLRPGLLRSLCLPRDASLSTARASNSSQTGDPVATQSHAGRAPVGMSSARTSTNRCKMDFWTGKFAPRMHARKSHLQQNRASGKVVLRLLKQI